MLITVEPYHIRHSLCTWSGSGLLQVHKLGLARLLKILYWIGTLLDWIGTMLDWNSTLLDWIGTMLRLLYYITVSWRSFCNQGWPSSSTYMVKHMNKKNLLIDES